MKTFKNILLLLFMGFLISCEEDSTGYLEFDTTNISMKVNETRTLSYTTNVNNTSASWSSSNPDIVSVDNNGNIKAHMGGKAVIFITVGTLASLVEITVDPDVYIGGWIADNSTYKKAVIWKNGEINELTDGTYEAAVNSIFVVDSTNVYAAGYKVVASEKVAALWKNGIEIPMLVSNYPSEINSIYVKDNIFYVAGYRVNQSKEAFININNTHIDYINDITNVPAGAVISEIKDVISYENSKYSAVGQYVEYNSIDYEGFQLSGFTGDTFNNSYDATSIYEQEGDVYVAGHEWDTTTNSAIAKYWKNGREIIINNGSGYRLKSITVSENGTTIIGSQGSPAAFWKCSSNNEQGTKFPVIDSGNPNYTPYEIVDAYILNGADYYIGNSLNGNYSAPTYWFNGTPTMLINTNVIAYAKATDLFLK